MGCSVQRVLILVLVCVFSVCVSAVIHTQDLGGDMWMAVGISPPSDISLTLPKASVPGCVHTDWYNHLPPTKENNPYYRFNDVAWQNVAKNNWSYRRNFTVDLNTLKHKEQWLVCEGLDTVANVSVNGKLIGDSKNMFIRHLFNVTGILRDQDNYIEVSFESALRYTETQRKSLKYSIPPECPPDVQHGFCHINLIRKEQCSFSWDWGPGFATQGIWKPIYIMALDEAVMMDMTAYFDWSRKDLYIEMRFQAVGHSTAITGWVDLFLEEFNMKASYKISITDNEQSVVLSQNMSQKPIEYWWPNGQGNQKLYNITARFRTQQSQDITTKTIWFGFRKVELVQESINGSNGLSFYFKINDKPIFAKGSNWIPADAFLNRLSKENYTNLLQSAKDANMNMLRVWGGGIYENDIFYELADRMGIMIWHDFMFACAMYPADKGFLQSVTMEVNDTLWRLKHHPSIVIWAGNNENEAALGTNWYNTTDKFEQYKKDYVSLYVDTIGDTVLLMDSSRPFLTSSPTNGMETKQEGWVAKNPYDTHYGDTHYYDYNDDCLDWTKYPKTRFASEYGFQSWPSIETLTPVSEEADLSWSSNFSMHRNHHANGNEQILNQISMHFNLPKSEIATEIFESQVYLSQVMQALCYKSETEFYRRSRSEIVKGEGHTMGALYWQLNDIWQAPTWSSIEYGGKWKAVHYYAKNFFSNVALTAFDDDTVLTIYSLSDIMAPIEPVTLTIEMHTWGDFGIVHSWYIPIYITPQSSKLQYQESIGTLLHYGGCGYKELCYFVIYLKEMPEVAPTFFNPVPFKDIQEMKEPSIEILDVKQISSSTSGSVLEEYQITLKSDSPAFFTWLEAYGIRGRFSDNAFFFYTPTKNVTFYAWERTTPHKLKSSLNVKSLADVYKKGAGKTAGTRRNLSDEPEIKIKETYWLADINTQVTVGICGAFSLLIFTIPLVLVVMKLNSPQLDRPRVGLQTTQEKIRRVSMVKPHMYSDQEELLGNTKNDDEGGAFLLRYKSGYGHNPKKVEIKFYVK